MCNLLINKYYVHFSNFLKNLKKICLFCAFLKTFDCKFLKDTSLSDAQYKKVATLSIIHHLYDIFLLVIFKLFLASSWKKGERKGIEKKREKKILHVPKNKNEKKYLYN